MTEIQISKPQHAKIYDLEERTFVFAKRVRNFTRAVTPKTIDSFEYSKQLIRASASVAANYIEANESLGKKDFVLRIKICRKEAKESRLWLKLIEIDCTNNELLNEKEALIQETSELTKIFTSILQKSVTRF